jgi:hypothetical protein
LTLEAIEDFTIGSPEKSHQPSPPETIPSSPPDLMDFVEEFEPRLPPLLPGVSQELSNGLSMIGIEVMAVHKQIVLEFGLVRYGD